MSASSAKETIADTKKRREIMKRMNELVTQEMKDEGGLGS